MYILNFIDIITESNVVFYILVIILVVISVSMFYLIYSQNKEMALELKRRQQEEIIEDEGTAESVDEPARELVAVTDKEIPDKLEYTQALWKNDPIDLKEISKKIENSNKNQRVEINSYEEEQEKTAIISYDELVSHVDKNDMRQSLNENISSSIKDDNTSDNIYSHEEEFLNSLKDLQNILN